MSWVAVAVGVVGTATSLIVGGTQKRKAKKELAKLNADKPIETMPEEIKQSQELANLRAKTGLPSEQYNMAQKNIQRQQQRALRGAADRKMGLAMLPYLDDNANRAINRFKIFKHSRFQLIYFFISILM